MSNYNLSAKLILLLFFLLPFIAVCLAWVFLNSVTFIDKAIMIVISFIMYITMCFGEIFIAYLVWG